MNCGLYPITAQLWLRTVFR